MGRIQGKWGGTITEEMATEAARRLTVDDATWDRAFAKHSGDLQKMAEEAVADYQAEDHTPEPRNWNCNCGLSNMTLDDGREHLCKVTAAGGPMHRITHVNKVFSIDSMPPPAEPSLDDDAAWDKAFAEHPEKLGKMAGQAMQDYQARMTELIDTLYPIKPRQRIDDLRDLVIAAVDAISAALADGDKEGKHGPGSWQNETIENQLDHSEAHGRAWRRGDTSESHLAHRVCRDTMAYLLAQRQGQK
jgi:hypothetical protein